MRNEDFLVGDDIEELAKMAISAATEPVGDETWSGPDVESWWEDIKTEYESLYTNEAF